MTLKNLLRTTLLGATVIAVPPSAWAAAADSQTFIKDAIQGNLAEISVGQLAQQKGTTDAIKSYGQMLVSDHTKANQDAMDVAKTLGVTVPTGPNDEQKSMHDKLASETGTTFDTDFVNGMVADHKKDVADYKQAATMQDAAGQYAGQTLPTLQGHLDQAQKLASDTGNMGGTTTGMAGAGMAPQAGANSFTEGQAKSRIESAGFSNVSALKKDDQGIWRGTATKNGQSVPVALDFKGNASSSK